MESRLGTARTNRSVPLPAGRRGSGYDVWGAVEEELEEEGMGWDPLR